MIASWRLTKGVILFTFGYLGDMMEEDDDENGEEAQEYDADGNPVDDDEMVELQDDSVQGFFTHKGTTSSDQHFFIGRNETICRQPCPCYLTCCR